MIQPVQTVAPVEPQIQIDPAPVINSFSVDVASLQQGQTATLSWTVSDVLERDFTVTISPDIGTVSSSGSRTISPVSTTTYTLTATNVDGSVSASVTVSVAPAVYEAASEATSSNESGFLSWFPDMGNGAGSNTWMSYALLIAILAAAAAVIIFLTTRPKPAVALTGEGTGCHPKTETSTGTRHTTIGSGARFVTADGEHIALRGNTKMLGRNDFISLIKQDKADLISRQHLRFEHKNNEYYIEDNGSTNGTRLNGVPITGKGRQLLKDNDLIDLGDTLKLTFKT